MALFGPTQVSGESSFFFNANVDVQFVNVWVDTLANTQLLSNASPQRIMHAGWFGLGYAAGVFTSAPPSINWWKYLEFESESLYLPRAAGGAVNCDTFYWRLNTGVTMQYFIGT